MADLSRYGHRQRMRDTYIKGGMELAPDHNVLELYISLLIPQKDVKPIAYELINTFGSLEHIFDASVEELMQVKGIGETTAVGLSLIKEMNRRVLINRNNSIRISSVQAAMEYCKNLLFYEKNEKLCLISLDASNEVINVNTIATGTPNSVDFNIRMLIDPAIHDKAVSVLLTHNHPSNMSDPSMSDVNMTMKALDAFSKIEIKLVDHIIVSNSKCVSLREHKFSKQIFKNIQAGI